MNTTIEEGNLYVTTGTISGNTITHNSGKCVEIFSANIEYDYQNEEAIRSLPVSGGQVGTKEPVAFSTGIKMILEVISSDGALLDDDDSTGIQKRDYLLDMAKKEKELKIVFGTTQGGQTIWQRSGSGDSEVFGAAIVKMKFRQTAGKRDNTTSGTPYFKKYDINIQLKRAKNISER